MPTSAKAYYKSARQCVRLRMAVCIIGTISHVHLTFATEDLVPTREQNKIRAAELINAAREAFRDKPDTVLLLPGLIANRETRQVTLFGESTGHASTEPIEFFIVSESSGHDYEALAVAFVTPSDVHAALEFIRIQPGHPVNPGKYQMWPKGDRVTVTFELDGKTPQRLRAQDLLLDDRTGKPLPHTGFPFVGSAMAFPPAEPDREVYGADQYDPHSIAANYNELYTVLDVPRRAVKGDQYQHLSSNPDHPFAQRRFLKIILAPERPDGPSPIRDLDLHVLVRPTPPLGSHPLGAFSFRLGEADSAEIELSTVLATFERGLERGEELYLTLWPEDALKLTQVETICRAIAGLEDENGIRIEAPPQGHLYYRAFLPPKQYRERKERPSQPWEVRLKGHGEQVRASLTHVTAIYGDDPFNPDFTERKHEVPDPTQLRLRLVELEDALGKKKITLPRALLVFAPEAMRYGAFNELIAPLMDEYPIIYVFLVSDS